MKDKLNRLFGDGGAEKRVVTRTGIQKDLCSKKRSEMIVDLVGLGLASLFLFMVTLSLTLLGLIPWIAYTVAGVLWLVIAGITAKEVFKKYRFYADCKKGLFSVVDDHLDRITEEEYDGLETRYFAGHFHRLPKYVDCFYFANHNRAIAPQNVVDYSLEGDAFYVVHFDSEPNTVIAFFNAKIYDYDDTK